MKNLLLPIILLISLTVHSQHYYKDIVGTREVNERMKTYLNAKVQSVTATGYDGNGMKSSDFNEWQEVQANGTILKITTRTGQSVTRLYYQFDDNTRLINSRDSSAGMQITTTFTYDNAGNLVLVNTTTQDSLHEFDQTDARHWRYNTQGKPETMLRIINTTDSTEYRFSLDESGNVKDEMLYHRGGVNSPVYYFYEENKIHYYYDDQNRLTDITKYNKKAKRLLPDYMFEYNDNSKVIQKLTTVSNMALPDYFLWRYAYNDKGLKRTEILYNKFKETKGRIDYAFTYAP